MKNKSNSIKENKEVDKEKRKDNYKKFYKDLNMDENKLIQKYANKDKGLSGWQCVCNYCLNRQSCTPKHTIRKCCETGKPCNIFEPDIGAISKEEPING